MAGVGQRALARVADLDGDDRVARARRAQRARPAAVAEVRDDDDHAARPRQALHARQRVGDPGAGGGAVGDDTGLHEPPDGRQRAAPPARRQQPDLLGAGDDDADAPAAPDREPRDDLRHSLGDVALEPVGGAERHRGRDVEHQPGGDRALGDLQADVRHAGARAGRGVEAADVVARLVGPQLRDLGAGAEAGREVVAGQHPGRAPAQREVQPRDRVGGQAPRALAARGDDELGGAHAASASGALPGGATTSSTRSSRSSGFTPSASAS